MDSKLNRPMTADFDRSEVELGSGLTAQFLATPIESAVSVRPLQYAAGAANRLGSAFDQAPVISKGRLLGHVLTRELREAPPRTKVEDLTHPLSAETKAPISVSVGEIVRRLREHGLVFLVTENEVTGFVTPFDLNKQAARAYFYLLIARLEIALAELIRDARDLAQQKELALKLPNRGVGVRGRFLVDLSEGREVDYVTHMDFTHLVKLIETDSEFRTAVGARSATAWNDRVGGLPQLRNEVMHLTRNMVSSSADLDRLLKHEQVIREVLTYLEARPPA